MPTCDLSDSGKIEKMVASLDVACWPEANGAGSPWGHGIVESFISLRILPKLDLTMMLVIKGGFLQVTLGSVRRYPRQL